jgi:dTDP-glucose pyrophosphorylase
MKEPTLIVMAAGIGSRYGGLKQIDPIGPNGEIVIDYSIYDALKAGFKKVVFVIRKDIEETFRRKIGKNIERRVETAYVFQELSALPEGFSVPVERKKPWGTSHAVLSCKDAVATPFAVVNADDFYGAAAFKKIYNYLKNVQDEDNVYNYCLIGYVLKNTLSEHGHVARGICSVSADGYLLDIHERIKIRRFGDIVKYTEDDKNWTQISEDSVVSMNIWGFTTSLFAELKTRFEPFLKENMNNIKAEYLLPVTVGRLIKEGKAKVKVIPTAERWFGVTYREDMPEVRKAIRELIAKGVYPAKLWS